MSMHKSAIIIQARTGSTRLPSKMILPFFGDKGILGILLSGLRQCGLTDRVIVATTTNSRDDVICDLAGRDGIKCYRGDEDDVLNRFIQAAEHYNVSKIIRICADNPFLDLRSLDELIRIGENTDADYVSYCTSDRIPTIKTHYGFWAEYVTLAALKRVVQQTGEKTYHEHVTNYIYTHPSCFKIELTPIPADLEHRTIRLTIDTLADFQIQQKIFEEVFHADPDFGLSDVVSYLDKHNDLYAAMDGIIKSNQK